MNDLYSKAMIDNTLLTLMQLAGDIYICSLNWSLIGHGLTRLTWFTGSRS